MVALAAGHGCVDACQGAVAAMLPFMVDRHGLSLTEASALVLAATAASSVVPSYTLAFAAVLLSGLGVAAYHPEGSRFANYVSGARRRPR